MCWAKLARSAACAISDGRPRILSGDAIIRRVSYGVWRADKPRPPQIQTRARAHTTQVSQQALQEVQIDGQVLLKVLKHCKECMPSLVTGQLLGLDIGSTLEVTSAFPFPVGMPRVRRKCAER